MPPRVAHTRKRGLGQWQGTGFFPPSKRSQEQTLPESSDTNLFDKYFANPPNFLFQETGMWSSKSIVCMHETFLMELVIMYNL